MYSQAKQWSPHHHDGSHSSRILPFQNNRLSVTTETTAITKAEETHGFGGYCSYCIIAITKSAVAQQPPAGTKGRGTLTTLLSDLLRIPDGCEASQ